MAALPVAARIAWLEEMMELAHRLGARADDADSPKPPGKTARDGLRA